MDHDDPDEVDTTSNSFCASRSSFCASANASHVATIVAPRIMLLQILAAWPAPASPQWTAFWPMISNSGRTVANASSLPPAMKVSVPAAAPPIPPETGASSDPNSAAAACAATSRALSTSTVEQSHRIAPGFIAGITCAATDFRICPFGSMVMTTSAPAAASTAPVAGDTPSTSAAAGSKPDTSCPAAARLRAIGAPMFPSPMKPIFMPDPPIPVRLPPAAPASHRLPPGLHPRPRPASGPCR